MLKDLSQQFDQMMIEMNDMIAKMNNLNVRLEKMKNQIIVAFLMLVLITIASIMNASTLHQSDLHIMTISISAIAFVSTTASVSIAAFDSVSAMIIQIESIVSAFVVSASVFIMI